LRIAYLHLSRLSIITLFATGAGKTTVMLEAGSPWYPWREETMTQSFFEQARESGRPRPLALGAARPEAGGETNARRAHERVAPLPASNVRSLAVISIRGEAG
jgi:hypothetical protein